MSADAQPYTVVEVLPVGGVSHVVLERRGEHTCVPLAFEPSPATPLGGLTVRIVAERAGGGVILEIVEEVCEFVGGPLDGKRFPLRPHERPANLVDVAGVLVPGDQPVRYERRSGGSVDLVWFLDHKGVGA